MYKIPLFLILFWTSVATAGVINVEFKFTPYVGDPLKSDQVETVPGNARVFMEMATATRAAAEASWCSA